MLGRAAEVKFLMDRLFGRGATLKRETVVLCWFLLGFIVVEVFAFVPPEHVRSYEYLVSGLFWPIIVLLAAIFGIQLVPSMGGGKSEETTRISTPTQTIETTTTKTAADPVVEEDAPSGGQ